MTALRVREATVADAPSIAQTIQGGFSAELLQLFIYGCRGIAGYVAAQIAARARGGDTLFSVGERGAGIDACIELRALPDQLFLNYVAVAPAARRSGAGNQLLDDAIRRMRLPAHCSLGLDVLETNSAALAWYASLGLEHGSTTVWWGLALDEEPAERPRAVVGLPQAELAYAAFGFSRVTLAGSGDVGLLGDRWFRITDAAMLCDASVHAALRTLDPKRQILALLPDGALPAALRARARRLANTRRLTGDLDKIIAKLEEKLR